MFKQNKTVLKKWASFRLTASAGSDALYEGIRFLTCHYLRIVTAPMILIPYVERVEQPFFQTFSLWANYIL